jgi:hypothetical protein
VGQAACATTAWRFRGQLRVTAVVKTTFSWVPAAPMALADPDEIHAVDVHYDGDPWSARGLYPPRPDGATGAGGDPTRSLWAPSDVTPYRQFADVVLVGHAHVSSTSRKVARLAVLNEQTPIDKSIRVESRWTRGSVALVYEHALGGPGWPDNPVGTGRDAGSPRPTLTALDDPRRPACFGPIARAWPARARWLGALDPTALAGPIAEVPDLFDWQYFQAAPPEQRTGFLRGDEWILLEGLHAEHAVLQMRLPGVGAAGRVYGLDGGPTPITFHADSLFIDTDRGQCSLTFRGHFPVPDEDCLPRLTVLAGAELAGRPLRWPVSVPTPASELGAVMDDPSTAESAAPAEPDEELAFGLETLPFTTEAPLRRQSTQRMSWPDGGAPEVSAAPVEARSLRQVTLPLHWPVEAQPVPLPFKAPPPETTEADFDTRTPEAAPRIPRTPALPFEAPDPSDGPFGGTVELRRVAEAMPSPFRLAEPGAPAARVLADIPGAPWASSSAPAVPRPPGGRQQTLADQPIELLLQAEAAPAPSHREEDEITVERRRIPPSATASPELAESAAKPEPEPATARKPEKAAEPTEPAEPTKAPDGPTARAWSWATTAEPRVAEGPPRVPPPLPRVEVQRSIYGRFNPAKKP